MANLNVNRNVADPFYRYKMPRIIAKVEGKGNGIKTVIVNMVEVAKALLRPPTYPCKYFGCELGAQTQFDIKNDRYIVNGSHESTKLQDLLDGFIKRFVLCDECDNPETKLNIMPKKGTISSHCTACGHTGMVDMRHKLTTFIIKNPPGFDPSAAQTPSKKDKKGKKGKKDKENGDVSPDANAHGEDEPDFVPPVRSNNHDDGFDEDDWGDDTSAAAVQARMDELTGAAKSMTCSDDLEKTQAERIDQFYRYIKNKKEGSQVTGVEAEKDIVGEAERLDIKEKAPLVLAELLYDNRMLTQIKQYRTLFLRFTNDNQKAQKYLLGAFEQLVGNEHKELMGKVPQILKAFYDLDIVEEEVLIDWDKKASKKYVAKEVSKEIHEKASPFIKWLAEAEEESSEEEEELEVVYSNTEKVGTQTIKPAADKGKKPKEDEEDLDIDAI